MDAILNYYDSLVHEELGFLEQANTQYASLLHSHPELVDKQFMEELNAKADRFHQKLGSKRQKKLQALHDPGDSRSLFQPMKGPARSGKPGTCNAAIGTDSVNPKSGTKWAERDGCPLARPKETCQPEQTTTAQKTSIGPSSF